MSPITRATRPSTSPLPAPFAGPFSPGRTAVITPSKPRIRKAPQRVGKSASAIFFTLSNPIIPFYFAGEGCRFVLADMDPGWSQGLFAKVAALSDSRSGAMSYHELAGAFMRDHLATLLDDFRRFDRQIAVVRHQGIRRSTTSYGEIARLAGRFAALLVRRGIVPGDRVLLWGENGAEWIASLYGCMLRGVLAVPLDAYGSAEFAARVA